MRVRILSFVCLLSVGLPLEAATVPTGILPPAFGLNQQPGPPNVFVNNTNASATDSNNPFGTPTRPRRTVPTVLPAGAVVEVRGGPYATGALTWTSQGTLNAPVFVIGVGNPVFSGNGAGDHVRTAGSFLIIEGFIFSGAKIEILGTATAVRSSEIRFNDTTAVAVLGHGTVLSGNAIHHNGDANNPIERDTHGVYVLPGTFYTWVLGNDIHHNGGDGVQVGSSESLAGPQYVFIGGNSLHEDRENGVDVKLARDVVIAGNRIWGYVVRSSSAGEAIIVHGGPERVWVLNNLVAASNQGIVCSGATGYAVVGNLVVGIRHSTQIAYSSTNLYHAAGILTYSTTSSAHINNTIWASDAGISVPSGGKTDVVNNLVGALSQPTGAAVRFGNSTLRNTSVVTNNLLSNDPGFVDPSRGDFRVRSGSPVIDAGVAHPFFETFRQLYGVLLDRDYYGGARFVGRSPDIGATEFQGGS